MATPKKKKPVAKSDPARKCGLCGKTRGLTKTPCCGNWICDDEHKYVLFSYGRNSCSRNHRNLTLCSSHWEEKHSGNWWECDQCREGIPEAEYVWYGTNEYNFRTLENPPELAPVRCAKCGAAIQIGAGGYGMRGGKYLCLACTGFRLPPS